MADESEGVVRSSSWVGMCWRGRCSDCDDCLGYKISSPPLSSAIEGRVLMERGSCGVSDIWVQSARYKEEEGMDDPPGPRSLPHHLGPLSSKGYRDLPVRNPRCHYREPSQLDLRHHRCVVHASTEESPVLQHPQGHVDRLKRGP